MNTGYQGWGSNPQSNQGTFVMETACEIEVL